ncbi:cytoplasmic dynein 1 light intermediate chain 2 isoform X2 [Falco biarmicus]|uniref:cytoplasmic dynein 1 light intermediate chain 2 isoform X2 n=1 Tax=Falco rusticolus TaxID=120794 RepID=UPI0018869AE1|nr:cytoplasmic dynein 1 light intermediate chain 2 isoform X2 [Falco rusticolus]XP_040471037.1 cytoplasmic dynein 1 light intermediate chain 2 isoform X2 [Falco naumanni]XP_055582648.1 cytoplasmic dynein 1 light intermediate chain 2 isoform X2 [Falco cherrug]XP_055674567.1 cytoplasmic dynein 1 light intermediate chain 2 isoform X1 [Falco peregrinus]XP_056216701.1 cytoplasmic dynein 1 light intermediate chain 2 isoform X2 [Falco biarmicus]
MAPVLVEKKLLGPDGPGGAELPSEEEEGQNLWSSILSEVSTRSRSKLPSGKNILVFGDDGSGKTTLMAKIQGAEHGKKGRGLEYLYLNIHDEDRDVIKEFQEYVEPEEGYQGSPQRRGPSGQEDEHVSLPLGENVLTHNLGIPVLVVCTKCDAVSVLEKEHDYREEHFDFIQSHIRRFCLQYGAALIYTSVKEEKNLDLLYKYIVHKTYGFQFTTPALVVEKDAVFIPAGWDNEKKIAILHENFTTVKPEDAYEDFIVKPPVRKLVHDKELAAEDEQVFLMKQQSFLAKQPATPTRASESPARGPAGSPRTQGRAGPANVPSASPITSVKKPDPNIKNNAASEGVLASFFNSLLSKKTGSPGSPGAGGVQSTAKKSGQKTVLTNVQEELDRMTRKPDSMVTTNSPPTENEA